MNHKTTRRDAMRLLGMGSAAGLFGLLGSTPVRAASPEQIAEAAGATPPIPSFNNKGLPPLKIRSVKAIGTAPEGANLVMVKVETTEPGLYGLGCATFTQRAEVVVTAINENMADFCVGKDVEISSPLRKKRTAIPCGSLSWVNRPPSAIPIIITVLFIAGCNTG